MPQACFFDKVNARVMC